MGYNLQESLENTNTVGGTPNCPLTIFFFVLFLTGFKVHAAAIGC